MEHAALTFALIGCLGVGSQWLAWRIRVPAIVLMLLAGLLAGPVLGILHPTEQFGDLLRPIVAVAVAIILFEGGLTLNFSELRDAAPSVRRLVLFGGPLGWLFSTLAAHYAAGLGWEASIVFGGILVVTGPTVVIPLLRQARLATRPASILRWEAIVNDPVGALCAVLAFEVITALRGAETVGAALTHLLIGVVVALIAGYVSGWAIARAFRRGWAPEYMKSPILLIAVIGVYASTDMVLHESGLLAVTVMGIYLANAHLPSLTELQRFKEYVTVLLVSGVFILLAASLDLVTLSSLDWRAAAFVLAIILVARPLAIMLSLIGTVLPTSERAMIAWIGPRGVVAVAVSGFFGVRLVDIGVVDGALLPPLAFALVAVTVVVHGFSMGPLARALGLTSREPRGVVVIGATAWPVALAKALKEAGVPVIIADSNWFRLRRARQAEIAVYHGEILSEAAEHTVDLNRYGFVIAATDNDAYNALVCTDFGPEFGRGVVFQIGRHEGEDGERDLPVTLGGRTLGSGQKYEELSERLQSGWKFTLTGLTEEYSFETYLADRDAVEVIAIQRKSGELEFARPKFVPRTGPGDRVLGFVRADG